MLPIFLTNSLINSKEIFTPINEGRVKMYVCGPTVYNRAHIGNIRSAVVYDVLFRLLRQYYEEVIYVRNITDVDDKIIDAAKKRGAKSSVITKEALEYYNQDIRILNCLVPSFEPKATEHIQDMIVMIENLIKRGFAYLVSDHVLFDITSYPDYGILSNRSLDEMIAGARIEVLPFKRDPGDFVLWKPCNADDIEYGFNSPWGVGRPGWHIECSAMSSRYLGHNFDIHGGGFDLIFPHHENEIAQSRCSDDQANFANYWVHNGFLTVDGEKMSKSTGNFKTIKDLVDQGVDGATLRYFYLTTQYRKPIDLTDKALQDSNKALKKIASVYQADAPKKICSQVLEYIADDLNTPAALAHLHELVAISKDGNDEALSELSWSLDFLGLDLKNQLKQDKDDHVPEEITKLAEERFKAKIAKDWVLADQIRVEIMNSGYKILDSGDSYRIEKIS